MNDLRIAVRQLAKNPGFALVAILTLALGIGANTAMFSVINAVLLRPLPFADPNQLVNVWQQYPKRGWSQVSFSLPNYLDVRAETNLFAAAGAYSLSAHTLTGQGEPERLNSIRISASFLSTLGVRPILGRDFLETEDRPNGERVVILSDRLWRKRFQADPAVIGRTIRLNDEWLVTIVGVLPPSFRIGEENPDLCLPLRLDPSKIGRGQRGLEVVARLRPGTEAGHVKAELSLVAERLRTADPWANGDVSISVAPLHEQLVRNVRPSLLILAGAVGCVLLIACANLANLSLARAYSRLPEITIRAALGANRARIVRQLLTESLLLAALGGALGLVLGKWVLLGAQSLLASRIPQAAQLSLDPIVLGFAFGASFVSGILFGLLPALAASRVNLVDSLKDGAKAVTGNLRRARLRGALVVAEVSLAFVLLIGAGLLLKSLSRLQAINPGFDPARLLTIETVLAGNRYTDNNAARLAAVREVTSHLASLPGVEAVTFGNSSPLSSDMDNTGVAMDGRTFAPNEYPFAHMRGVAGNYFQTLRVTLLEGRHLAESDNETGQKVAVINATMARQYWPQESAVGKLIRPDALQNKEWLTIVGVVADIKNVSLAQAPRPEIYFSYAQYPTRGLTVMLRTSVPPMTLAETARREIWRTDGSLAMTRSQTMEQTMRQSSSATRFQSVLLGAFAALALLLAATGIYSIISYSVSQRSREIGIRLALGARTMSVYGLIFRSGMTSVVLGIGIGAAAALVLTRYISQLLFEVRTTDPLVFVAVALVLFATGLVACWRPARRAALTDPIETLRHE